MNNRNDIEKLSEPFKALIGNQELLSQFLDMHPTPIEIFAPDGTSMFVNRACMEMFNHHDLSLIVGVFNLKYDPHCLEHMGQEAMDSIFKGEAYTVLDLPVPVQDFIEQGKTKEKPFEAATVDAFFLPLWDGETFACTVCHFAIKNMYHGRDDIIKAQKHIKEHWQDEFDLEKVARSAHLSKRHFQRIFKEVAGVTPNDFYQNVKLEKIQEKLLDGNLSIEQAFDVCGVDSHGAYFKLFKEKNEMTPAEYRKKNGIK
jgi:AraC-like DNA-binding protein